MRLEQELKRYKGLKFKIPIAVTLEEISKFEFDDPEMTKKEREIPTHVEEQIVYFNSREKHSKGARDRGSCQ